MVKLLENIYEKLKKYIRPAILSPLSENESDELIQKINLELLELIKIIDLLLEKEIILDKFLTKYNEDIQEDFTVRFQSYISKELKILEKLKNSLEVNSLNIQKESTINILKQIDSTKSDLILCNKKQSELISNKSFFEDKIILLSLISFIYEENDLLKFIFNFESEYELEFRNIHYKFEGISEIKNIPKDKTKKLYYFINDCFNFIVSYNIKVVLVTDDSARLLGIALLNKLKEQKKKEVIVAGYNPRFIIDNKILQNDIDTLIKQFSLQRKALTKKIMGNNILIIDEFISTGKTVFESKKFFENLGAKGVFIAGYNISPRLRDFYPYEKIDVLGLYEYGEGYNSLSFKNEMKQKEDFLLDRPITRSRTSSKQFLIKYKVINDLYKKLLIDCKELIKKRAIEKP